MKKIIAIIILFFFVSANKSFALEVSCKFEEVHSNGTVNQGILLYKKNKLRYEYNSSNLFIIFIEKNNANIFDKKTEKIKPLNHNLDLLNSLMDLADQYPYIPSQINNEKMNILIEKNLTSKFIKRISINSKRAKLSLYLNDCILEKPINNLFFSHNPVFSYK